MATLGGRIKHAWNAFSNQQELDRDRPFVGDYATAYKQPHRTRTRTTTGGFGEKTIIGSIYTRIGIDVAAVPMRHVKLDEDERYKENVPSGLTDCLRVQANIDQPGRAFRQDIVTTMLEEGVVAIVPVDTTLSPIETGGYDIKTLRVGRIVMWYPQHVRVELYNEQRGQREEITLPKSVVAIAENPLYSVMNEPNSTLQRLIKKLSLLDITDEKNSSGKLDLIIQLPYVIKSESKRQQAEQRRQDIEFQLSGSQYGIAYSEATEKITQLNRPVENNLLEQVKMLKDELYAELGLTPEVMNGSADESTMKNYFARTIEPLLDAIVESMIPTFLTKTARTQGQSIMYFRDPFKFVPIGGEGGIADIADKFARNEIASSNEIRQGIGMKPRPEKKADALINSNMPVAKTGVDLEDEKPPPEDPPDPAVGDLVKNLNKSGSEIDKALADSR